MNKFNVRYRRPQHSSVPVAQPIKDRLPDNGNQLSLFEAILPGNILIERVTRLVFGDMIIEANGTSEDKLCTITYGSNNPYFVSSTVLADVTRIIYDSFVDILMADVSKDATSVAENITTSVLALNSFEERKARVNNSWIEGEVDNPTNLTIYLLQKSFGVHPKKLSVEQTKKLSVMIQQYLEGLLKKTDSNLPRPSYEVEAPTESQINRVTWGIRAGNAVATEEDTTPPNSILFERINKDGKVFSNNVLVIDSNIQFSYLNNTYIVKILDSTFKISSTHWELVEEAFTETLLSSFMSQKPEYADQLLNGTDTIMELVKCNVRGKLATSLFNGDVPEVMPLQYYLIQKLANVPNPTSVINTSLLLEKLNKILTINQLFTYA